MLLNGKAAIVTGGTRGIGRSITLELAKEGADVSFSYLKSDKEAQGLVEEIEKIGRRPLAFRTDVRDFAGAKKVIEQTKEKFGRLDILVNNAGILRDKALMMMEPQDWEDVIDTDLSGVFNFSRAAIVTFMKQKSGSIVNITSVSGITGMPRQVNYSAAKAGVIGLTKSLAKEVAGYNIRVNAIAPGFIETDMLSGLKEDRKSDLIKAIPLGRLGNVVEVAKLVIFLLSEDANYITGQVIKIDGGLAM